MAEVNVSMQAMQKSKTLIDKAKSAMERGCFDIALDLAHQSLIITPHSEQSRRLYHEVRMLKFNQAKKSSLSLKMAELGAISKEMKIQSLSKAGKYDEALDVAEELLDINPTNPKFNEQYFDVALRSTHPEALLVVMDVLEESCGDNIDLLCKMGQAYMIATVFDKAADCFKKAAKLAPTNLNIQTQLKNAEAQNTMEAGGWNENAGKEGGYRKLLRNKQQAADLERKNKAIVTGGDADAEVNDLKAKIEKEPKNINYYRGLARILSQNKRFDEALEALHDAQRVNHADPELDRMCSETQIKSYESKISDLREAGKTDEADELETAKCQFVFDDLIRRVELYPNDLHLRYQLGLQYYTYESYDEAIQQFQLSQRSPKDRLSSLYYLACCFKSKGQGDMAIMQLETANSQIPTMDDLKKHIVYTMGVINEEKGNNDAAFNFYKDVYAADVGFLDIGERMERVYKLRSK